MAKKPDLDSAYSLKTPDDSRRLYGDWAQSYDESFAKASGYLLPKAVAEAFVSAGGRGPVLDLGAGTGLVGEALAELGIDEVDGVDLSPEMLAEAAMKGAYDRLFEGDLTATLDVPDCTYQGIVSAGTFTHGHVGPEAFDELLRIAATDALFALTINAEHFSSRGFEGKLESLIGQIKGLIKVETRIYDESRADDHGSDLAYIMLFLKA